MSLVRLAAAASLLVHLCLTPLPASATVFEVNSAADEVDADVADSTCATASGACTLRAAIQQSNATPGLDTIHVPAGTYVLSLPGRREDESATGDLDVLDDLTIVGDGSRVTLIDGGQLDRVLHAIDVSWLELSGFTVLGGLADGQFGSGLVLTGRSVQLIDVTARECQAPASAAAVSIRADSVTLTLEQARSGGT